MYVGGRRTQRHSHHQGPPIKPQAAHINISNIVCGNEVWLALVYSIAVGMLVFYRCDELNRTFGYLLANQLEHFANNWRAFCVLCVGILLPILMMWFFVGWLNNYIVLKTAGSGITYIFTYSVLHSFW